MLVTPGFRLGVRRAISSSFVPKTPEVDGPTLPQSKGVEQNKLMR